MLVRFLIYGALGWCLEIVFTGATSVLFERDRAASAKTYLWMFPIYGATALLMESVQDRLAVPWLMRALAYLLLIYLAELSSGWILRKAVGLCPWDYTGRGLNYRGLIRADYAPAWFAVAALFEPARRVVEAIASLPVFRVLGSPLGLGG